MKLDRNAAKKILNVVDRGLCYGTGNNKPGQMCVEAAICYVLEGDGTNWKPDCVDLDINSYKVAVNDQNWSSKKARALGMRRAAIAQLGSADISCFYFGRYADEYLDKNLVRFIFEKIAKNDYKIADLLELGKFFTDVAGGELDSDYIERFLGRTRNLFKWTKTEWDQILGIFAEACVFACVKLETPGSKWLNLTK